MERNGTMMQRLFTLTCDVCREEGPYGWYSAGVRFEAEGDGWKRIGGRDICPDCSGSDS